MTLVSGQAFAVISTGVGLAATPLLLRWLGDERFGAFRAASDWYGYLTLFELGLGGALLPLLADAYARRDGRAVAAIVGSGIRAYVRVVGLMLMGGLGLAAVITRLVPVQSAYTSDLRTGCLVGVLSLIVLPFAVFRGLAEAEQRGYSVSFLLVGQSLVITSVALLFGWAGWGITGQFVALLTGAFAFHLALACQEIWRRAGFLGAIRRSGRDEQVWRSLWQLNWPTFALNACGRVSLLTDNIIIGGLLSPAAVVPFYVSQRLVLLVQGQIQGISGASWAGLAELHAQGCAEIFNNRVIELTKIVAVIGVALLVPLAFLNREFVTLWVGPGRYGGDALSCIICVNALLLGLLSLWGWCVLGTGNVQRLVPAFLAQAAINLCMSVLLTLRCGLIGPVVGTTVSLIAVRCWYVPLVLHKLFGTSVRALVYAVVTPLALGGPYSFVLWSYARLNPALGWFELAFQMTVSAMAYLLAAWVCVLSRGERDMWVGRLNSLLYQRLAV